jgi:hypothetical protein
MSSRCIVEGTVNSYKRVCIFAALIFSLAAVAQTKSNSTLTIVYRDQHQQSLSSADVSRIDLKNQVLTFNRDGHEQQIPLSKVSRIEVRDAAAENPEGRSHFVGKWSCGLGTNSSESFFVTLDRDGQAHKTHGSSHGTWTFVNGEAHIVWDDGWRDAIAKVGNKYEKRAYAPGRSFTDQPSNVAEATRANDQSI